MDKENQKHSIDDLNKLEKRKKQNRDAGKRRRDDPARWEAHKKQKREHAKSVQQHALKTKRDEKRPENNSIIKPTPPAGKK
jgi:hypothetical protein